MLGLPRLVYWQSSASSFIHVPILPDGRYSASVGVGGADTKSLRWLPHNEAPAKQCSEVSNKAERLDEEVTV